MLRAGRRGLSGLALGAALYTGASWCENLPSRLWQRVAFQPVLRCWLYYGGANEFEAPDPDVAGACFSLFESAPPHAHGCVYVHRQRAFKFEKDSS